MTYPGPGDQWQSQQGGYQQGGYPPGGPQQGYPQPGQYQPGYQPGPAQPGYGQQQPYGQPQGYPQPGGPGGPPSGGFPQQPYGYGPPPQPPKKASKGLIIGVVAAVIAVGAGAGATVWALNRGTVQAGAENPTLAAQSLVTAIGNGDVAGLLGGLVPAEAEVLVDLNSDLTEEFKRLKIYKQDADPNKLPGLEIKTRDLKFDEGAAEQINDHLTITKLVSGTVVLDSDATKLPLTEEFLEKAFPGGLEAESQHEEIDIAKEIAENGGDPIRIATVKHDGEWYPSLFYTVADYALAEEKKEWPKEPIANNGANSPKAAVQSMIEAAIAQDLTRVIELLPPDEMGVLHDVGPMIVDAAGHGEAQDITITSFQVEEQDVTGGTKVVLQEIGLEAEGEQVKVRRDGDCYQVEAGGEQERLCASEIAEEMGDSKMSSDAKRAMEHLASGLLRNSGVVTTEFDGKHYVSPLRTVTDLGLTVVKSLEPEDVLALIELAK